MGIDGLFKVVEWSAWNTLQIVGIVPEYMNATNKRNKWWVESGRRPKMRLLN